MNITIPDIAAEVLFNQESVCHFANKIHPENVEQIKPPQQTEKPPVLWQVLRVLNGHSHAHKHGVIKASKNKERQSKYGEKEIFKTVLVLNVVAHLHGFIRRIASHGKHLHAAYLGPIQEQIRAIGNNCDDDKANSHEANVIRCPNEKDGYDVMRDHLNKIFLPRFN